MNILIAIGFALLAIFVLVALLKLAFGLIVLGVAIAVAVGGYVAINKLLTKAR